MSNKATSRRAASIILSTYVVVFFVYMFAPLVVMVLAAFNAYPFPSVTHWDGFTLKWFGALGSDERLLTGLGQSFIIGFAVVLLSVPVGLSAALVLSRMQKGPVHLLYAVLVSPILTPGIVLGISTLLFWRMFDVSAGVVTAILAQTTFIAAYSMLLFMARLQRYDRTLDEAALDLGASGFMVFRTITLPFLVPTIAIAAVMGFLQSFENYNTTVFSIGADYTLVTEIGSRMRRGLSPAINALGVVFVLFTVTSAVLWAVFASPPRQKS